MNTPTHELTAYQQNILDNDSTGSITLLGGAIGWGKTLVAVHMMFNRSIAYLDPTKEVAEKKAHIILDTFTEFPQFETLLRHYTSTHDSGWYLSYDGKARVICASGRTLYIVPKSTLVLREVDNLNVIGTLFLAELHSGEIDSHDWMRQLSPIVMRGIPSHYEHLVRMYRDNGVTFRLYEPSRWEGKGIPMENPFPVFVGDRLRKPLIVRESNLLAQAHPEYMPSYIQVPGCYRAEFEHDIVKALRDIAGIA